MIEDLDMMNQCYRHEIEHTIQDVRSCGGDLLIALVADSHLDNSVTETIENLSAVDQAVQFDCCVHLGDFLAGEIGGRYAKLLLRQQLDLFRTAVSSGRFFPVQGNHDACSGPYAEHLWPEAVGFLDAEQGICRHAQKPYYYVDIAKEKVRLVFLCSYFYEQRGGEPVMIFGYEEKQIQWLQNEALVLPSDWTVMLFSHDAPFSALLSDEKTALEKNDIANGNPVFSALDQCRKQYGFDIAGWFIGHYHGDRIVTLFGIPFVITASETAYDPQLFDDDVRFWERDLGTPSEDLWDALVLKKSERRVYLKRFGAGEDRIVHY